MGVSELRKYLSVAIKFILILSIINAIYYNLWHIMSANIFLLILMFIPQFLKKSYKINIPVEIEFLLLAFIISTFFLGKIKGIAAPILFGIAMGFVGLLIMWILYSSNQIKKNKFLIVIFSFSFAVALSFILELIKFYLKGILRQELSLDIYTFSMRAMTYVIIGVSVSLLVGYLYMKDKKGSLRKLTEKFKKLNPKIFSKTDLPEEILELIKKGENEKIEFKSTLRVNLYTNEIDKKIEFATLKTIASFLNSDGGTLLIGVSDNGQITGIEKDKFENPDRFGLHITNLLREKIGKKYIPLITTQTVLVEGKNIFKIECRPSDKPVFLKMPNGEEEFYIRAGPSSTQIRGSELIEYIERRFRREK